MNWSIRMNKPRISRHIFVINTFISRGSVVLMLALCVNDASTDVLVVFLMSIMMKYEQKRTEKKH